MQQQKCNVVLTLDNFSGHYVKYQPRNVLVVFFKPNLTAWIQLLDASIIHCVKVHYRQEQCRQALDWDDAGEEDIWVMDQLEAMRLMDCAWDNVTVDTIVNCWGHTKILPSPKQRAQQGTGEVSQAWLLMQEFATSDMRLPQAKERLEKILRGQYKAKSWKPALKAVMDVENDEPKALASLDTLECTAGTTSPVPAPSTAHANGPACLAELASLEAKLMTQISNLGEQNCLHGNLPTLNNVLAPEGKNDCKEEVTELTDTELIACVCEELAGPAKEEEEAEVKVEVRRGPAIARCWLLHGCSRHM
jgi:hypothetical protein